MLDTIVLTLSKGMYYISEPDRFEPSAKWVMDSNASMGGRGYIPSKQNPTAQELRNGIYKPRLTLTNRFNHTGRREATLKVELSIPKLLFGNNFDELTDSDFGPAIKLLKSKLKDMGVMVWDKFLVDAPVSAVHYSKNIPLTNGLTPHFLISKIKEANIKLSLDINQSDYRNYGHSYKLHSNSYEVAFYDKVKDLEIARKSEKRAIETDNAMQLNLFDRYQLKKHFEILRMEVRLNKRQKIGQLFRALGISSELTYKNLFSGTTAQKVLLHYLDGLESQRLALFDYHPASPKALLADLIINNPSFGLKRTLQLYGLKQALDQVAPRELRAMFGNSSHRSWYRLVTEAHKVKLPVAQSPLGIIRTCLNRFEPLKLVDFQEQMINNDKYGKLN